MVTLVLLHAFPFDSRLFDAVHPALATATTVLTPDLRGFGAGPALGDPAPDPDLGLLADDVVAALDAVDVDRAVVGGVSMGGYVALALLRRHPERVAGLVLADTRSGPDAPAAAQRRHEVAAAADRGEVAAGRAAIAPLIADDAPANVRERLAGIAGDVPPETIAWAQRAMAARPDSTPLLAAAGVPVLIIVGERDAVTPPQVARDMAAASTGDLVELVELPGVGHLTPAEDPDGFAAAVTGWLSRRF